MYDVDLWLLFGSAFTAATVLPAQSEIVLLALESANKHNVLLLIVVASVGNILGACINWYLGGYLMHLRHKKWFPLRGSVAKKAIRFYRKWGIWSLLLAWAPFIGDPLTVLAGFLRANFFVFLILVSISKISRYVALVYFFT